MSGKSQALRKAFHEACGRAVSAQLEPEWEKTELGAESLTACFHRHTDTATQVLRLHLAERRHAVEIVIGIKGNANDPMPSVWWEDRTIHPNSTGYLKVLWSGELTYGTEEEIYVPKEFWCPEFSTTIEERLAALHEKMGSWFRDAEVHISTANA